MIRVNLLDHLETPPPARKLPSPEPAGERWSMSRREVVAGGLFIFVGLVILGVQVWRNLPPGTENVGESPAPVQETLAPETEERSTSAAIAEVFRSEASGESEAERATEQPAAPAAPPPPPSPTSVAAPEPATRAAPRTDSASGAPMRVEDLRMTRTGDGLELFLAIRGEPSVRSFRLDNPNRVAFDLPGAELGLASEQQSQATPSPLVDRVRIAQNSFDPPLVRMVLEVGEFPQISRFVTPEGVTIRVGAP